MYLSIPKLLKLNSSCLFGEPWNIQWSDLQEEKQDIQKAVEAVDEIRKNGKGPSYDKDSPNEEHGITWNDLEIGILVQK